MRSGVRLGVWLGLAAFRLAAQGNSARPAIAVLNLRFDGEHANVLEPGDTAVAAATTGKLRATLGRAAGVTLVDSTRVAAAVATAEAGGNPCDPLCAVAVGRALSARWVALGRLTKTSDLVWVFVAELVDVANGRAVLADGYELKGDATRMGPAGGAAFAQRIARAIGAGPVAP